MMLQYSLVGSSLGQEDAGFLNHALIVEKATARSVYLRLVDTNREALNYAINGFHVAVVRGIPGGCRESVTGPPPFADGGLKWQNVICSPLSLDAQPQARKLWNDAAGAYLDAYTVAKAQGWKAAKSLLANANLLANQAYDVEGVVPPSDPVTAEPEVAAAGPKSRRGAKIGAGLAIAGAALLTGTAFLLSGKKAPGEGGDPGGGMWPGGGM